MHSRRNNINLGLPMLDCGAAVDGATARVDAATGAVAIGNRRFDNAPLPRFMHDLLDGGGLSQWSADECGVRRI